MGEKKKIIKRPLRGTATSESGFTLIEILIAMTILAIGLLGLGGLAATATRSGSYAQDMTQATNIAQDRIEALLTVDFKRVHLTDAAASALNLDRNCTQTDATVSRPVYTCTPIGASAQVPLGNQIFTWSFTVTHMDIDGDGTANLNRDSLARVEVIVAWNDILTHSLKSVNMISMRGL